MSRKRMIATVLVMIFMLISLLPSVKGFAAEDGSITFDSALYKAMKNNLQQQGIQASYNDTQYTISISASEIAKVTSLKLSNHEITNLSGLEKFSNVTSLDLSANDLTDTTDLSALNSMKLDFLDLSSNELSDVSAITAIKEIRTVNLHNQIVSKVEVIDNEMVKEGTYQYQCKFPQIITEFAKPMRADWVEFSYDKDSSAGLKFDVGSFNANSDTIGLKIGNEDGTQFTGLANLKIKVTDMNNKLYNSQIDLKFVVINNRQRSIYLKDKRLYEAVKEQLMKGQTVNSELKGYTDSKNLYDKAYDEQQILIIDEDDLVNKITILYLSNKRISDLSGLEMFIGLETGLDVSSNYIKTIDTILDLQAKKEEEGAKTQDRFKSKAQQLQEKITKLETLNKELETVVKAYNEGVGKYNTYVASTDTAKMDKMLEQLKVLKEQGKRYMQLTGNNLSLLGVTYDNTEALEALNTITDASAKATEVSKDAAISGGEIKATRDKVEKGMTDIYNVYSKVYKLTSIITIDLKNITDEEFRTLSVERAKELLQAQATKITAIEKYFTEAEKNWAQSNYGIKYEKDKEAELSNYFTNKMKELEEDVNINSYKAELTKLRKFDAYVSYSSSCVIGKWVSGDSSCHKENYQLAMKNIDGEDTSYITEITTHDEEVTNDKILKLFSRIANASEDDVKSYMTLPELYKLNMSENLIENIDKIADLKELRELSMAQNEIVNIKDIDWTAIRHLHTLDLSFNNISDIKVLENIAKLKKLNVAKNLISGSLDFTIKNIDQLEKLDLSDNQIDDIENFKSQFEFMVKESGKDINEYIKDVIAKKISLENQNLTMNIKPQSGSTRMKVELPKIFRQLEEIDWDNTSFGINSLYGNAASDGSYVILETAVLGNRDAVVTVLGGIGNGTNCTIQCAQNNNTGSGDIEIDKIQINVNTESGSSVLSVAAVNDVNYIVVAKDTKVSDVLKDVTLNTDAYEMVIKDAKNESVVGATDTVKTNQMIVVDAISKNAQCKIVVKGDVTGDGSVEMGDILKLNQGRNGKITLNDAEKLAGNVAGSDDKIDMSDILKLNQYRLNKINEL